MKGGTRIQEYVITVLLGSIPFVVFVIRRASILGLNKKSAFFITVCLCGAVMLFPWALRLGWINWWVFSIIILLFISSVPWSKDLIKITKTKDKVVVSEISEKAEHNGYRIIEPILVDAIEPHQFQMELGEVEMESTVTNTEHTLSLHFEELGVSRLHKLPIDEIIDLGFQEKHAGNFKLAASYFSHVLSQDPKPELAFYLIIDSYWLWNNLGKRDYAITQLQTYVQKYLPLFSTKLRLQFDTWMVKENLLTILK